MLVPHLLLGDVADVPAPRRLIDSAAKLHQLADSVIWELDYIQRLCGVICGRGGGAAEPHLYMG
jgi:hypothetical protein